jgi:hypothetical protein
VILAGLYVAFNIFRYIPFILDLFKTFAIKDSWILSKEFSSSDEMCFFFFFFLLFFQFIYMVNYVDRFSYVDSFLHL